MKIICGVLSLWVFGLSILCGFLYSQNIIYKEETRIAKSVVECYEHPIPKGYLHRPICKE